MKVEILKQEIISEWEFYKRCAADMERRMKQSPKGSSIQRNFRYHYIFYKGRVAALRDLLAIIDENILR